MAEKKEPMRVVWIEWLDSNSDSVWMSKDYLKNNPMVPMPISSIGFLAQETKDTVVITNCDGGHSVNDPLCIPKRCIVARWEVTF